MQRICQVSGRPFTIDEQDLAFYERVSPKIGDTLYRIPPPTLCPEERQRRRLAFRNELLLYRSRCALSGKMLITPYSPDKNLRICDKQLWLDVDNTQFGRDIDFSRPFFEQFADLQRDTYKAAVSQAGEMINSDFAHSVGWLKNCYLLFDSGKSEECMYGRLCGYSRSCIDCNYTQRCELCYEGVKLEDCYGLWYSTYCKNCSFSAFLHSCIGCADCLCCANLRNRRFYFRNEPVSQARFRELWAYYLCGSHARLAELAAAAADFMAAAPRQATTNLNCEECTGDELNRCQNLRQCFNCHESRDCRYCYDLYSSTNDCADVSSFGEAMQYCYELAVCGGALGKSEVSNLYFSAYIYYGGCNIFYSTRCHENCQELFGCADLRRKQYCILNKQYRREEYFRLVDRLIGHMRATGEWGEFFPMNLSLFGYNESLAQEFFPLRREETLRLGAYWSEYEIPVPEVRDCFNASQLPDGVHEVGEELLGCAIYCAATGKPFRLTSQELKFYREQGLPLPRFHPEERHRRRLRRQNPRALWPRRCASCTEELLSSYAPERPERIFCEQCYLQNVA